jgi:hypothetical protein
VSEPLTREQILALGLAHEDIEVPAWGRTVRVRELSLAERDAFEVEVLRDRAAGGNLRVRLFVRTCVDPATGERIFGDGDAAALAKHGAAALQPLFLAAVRLSALSDKEAEELGKASGRAATSGSSTSSPNASG